MAGEKNLPITEIRKHSSKESCWVVVDGSIWDLTEFAPEHPGGPAIIYEYAGRDATKAYSAVHPPSLLRKNLEPSKLIGTVDADTIDEDWLKPPPQETVQLSQKQEKPPLETVINAFDFETIASRTLTPKTWAFYSSGATDCITRDVNHTRFDQIWFRPRVLVNVGKADTSTTIMGMPVSMPLFVSPSALARMVHPDGEIAIARAAGAKGIVQAVSTNASFSIEDICRASPNTTFFFQLYIDRNRENSSKLLKRAKELGMKAVILTVDAPVIGKREADERVKNDTLVQTGMTGGKTSNDKKGGGVGRAVGKYIDPRIDWKDLQWLRNETDLPIIVKGIQSAADAKLCVDAGVQGIILSNHGGRELDTAPASVMVLLELHKCCPKVFDRLEVYVDGGIRRGTDILKCLCLGAKAVGIGRHFLYSLNYGAEGVEHLIDILQDEFKTAMKLVGITDVSQVHPGLVNTLELDHLVPSTVDHPYAKWRPKARI